MTTENKVSIRIIIENQAMSYENIFGDVVTNKGLYIQEFEVPTIDNKVDIRTVSPYFENAIVNANKLATEALKKNNNGTT